MKCRKRRNYRKHKAIIRFCNWLRQAENVAIPHTWQSILDWSLVQSDNGFVQAGKEAVFQLLHDTYVSVRW